MLWDPQVHFLSLWWLRLKITLAISEEVAGERKRNPMGQYGSQCFLSVYTATWGGPPQWPGSGPFSHQLFQSFPPTFWDLPVRLIYTYLFTFPYPFRPWKGNRLNPWGHNLEVLEGGHWNLQSINLLPISCPASWEPQHLVSFLNVPAVWTVPDQRSTFLNPNQVPS